MKQRFKPISLYRGALTSPQFPAGNYIGKQMARPHKSRNCSLGN
jgi:hypothetical protein